MRPAARSGRKDRNQAKRRPRGRSLSAFTQTRALSPHRPYNSSVDPRLRGSARRAPIVLERAVTEPEQCAELAVLDELDQVQNIELRFESDVACASPRHRSLKRRRK